MQTSLSKDGKPFAAQDSQLHKLQFVQKRQTMGNYAVTEKADSTHLFLKISKNNVVNAPQMRSGVSTEQVIKLLEVKNAHIGVKDNLDSLELLRKVYTIEKWRLDLVVVSYVDISDLILSRGLLVQASKLCSLYTLKGFSTGIYANNRTEAVVTVIAQCLQSIERRGHCLKVLGIHGLGVPGLRALLLFRKKLLSIEALGIDPSMQRAIGSVEFLDIARLRQSLLFDKSFEFSAALERVVESVFAVQRKGALQHWTE